MDKNTIKSRDWQADAMSPRVNAVMAPIGSLGVSHHPRLVPGNRPGRFVISCERVVSCVCTSVCMHMYVSPVSSEKCLWHHSDYGSWSKAWNRILIKQKYLFVWNCLILIKENQRDWVSDLEIPALPTSRLRLYIGFKYHWDMALNESVGMFLLLPLNFKVRSSKSCLAIQRALREQKSRFSTFEMSTGPWLVLWHYFSDIPFLCLIA